MKAEKLVGKGAQQEAHHSAGAQGSLCAGVGSAGGLSVQGSAHPRVLGATGAQTQQEEPTV